MPLDHHQAATGGLRSKAEPDVAQLIRETSAQVRDSIEKSRVEVAQLVSRVARVEDEIGRGRDTTRSLAWVAGMAALLGFLAATLAWQVSHRVARIDSTLRSVATLMTRSATTTEAAFTRIDTTLAAQTAAARQLATAIASVESMGRQMQVTLADLDRDADHAADATGLIGRQLGDTALELSALRRELDARLEKHHEAFVAGRGEMLEAVTASIGRVESDLLRQADELKVQRQQVDVSAARMRQTQQRMLGEATQAVAAQLEGLREILDGLKSEIAEGQATVASDAAHELESSAPTIVEPVSAPAATGDLEPATEAAALDELAEPVTEAADDAGSEVPATAGDEPPVAKVAAEATDAVTE